MNLTESIYSAFTPSGKLRASINTGNPILAKVDSAREPCEVSVDLATEFARVLGAELQLLVFDTAGKSVETLAAEQADIGFFAIDPAGGTDIAFTAPYILIEGDYLVRRDSRLWSNDQVDCPTNRVMVGKGNAYDL